MTLRATTHDQFRIVLKWVKEHPVLARGDNEVEKGGRELKNKLWEKLTVELNEIGPPERTWMAWKRVLTDYKYSLKKKIQRRIASTSQGGSEILASLNDLETEALQASLLDWDFSDLEKLAASSETTPASDDSKAAQTPPEETTPATPTLQDIQQQNQMDASTQQYLANGNANPIETNINGNIESSIPAHVINGTGEIPNGSISSEDVPPSGSTFSDTILNNSIENGITLPNTTYTSTAAAADIAESAEDLSKASTTAVSYIKTEDCATNQAINMTTFPAAATTEVDQLPINTDGINIPSTAIMDTSVSATIPTDYSDPSGAINAALVQQLSPQQLAQYQSQLVSPNSLVTAQLGQAAANFLQPPHIGSQSEQSTQQLTADEMNMLIAREIDRMATAQKAAAEKTRKTQRKRPEKPTSSSDTSVKLTKKDKSSKVKKATTKKVQFQAQSKNSQDQAAETADQLQQHLQGSLSQQQLQPQPTTSHAKRLATKRPRPAKLGKEGKEKRFISGREFRHCLLALLTEANEMEKRRIMITETKVRNQTEIQNLEITRMNLEIMKLQKEITLLDHGTKILP